MFNSYCLEKCALFIIAEQCERAAQKNLPNMIYKPVGFIGKHFAL